MFRALAHYQEVTVYTKFFFYVLRRLLLAGLEWCSKHVEAINCNKLKANSAFNVLLTVHHGTV
jgi:hypothetical protein